MSSVPFDVSVVMCAHNEGRLLHHTIRSYLRAKDYAQSRGISSELIIVADKVSEDTRTYLENLPFENELNIKIHFVQNGDLGLSRNYGISKSSGDFVAFLDGDDLFCENWLADGVAYLRRLDNRKTIVHTEAFVGFGAEEFIKYQIESDSPDFHPYDLIFQWEFCNNSIGPREIYLDLPFESNDRHLMLGGEDWKWSMDSIHKGYVHKYVPKTAYFYRRHSDRVSLGSISGIVVKPSDLLLDRVITVPLPRKSRTYLPNFIKTSLPFRFLKKVVSFVLRRLRAVYQYKQLRNTWLAKEMTSIHVLEPKIFPRKSFLYFAHIFQRRKFSSKQFVFNRLVQSHSLSPFEYILVAPWIKSGGADKLTMLYAEALSSITSKKVLIVCTENEESSHQRYSPRIEIVSLGSSPDSLDANLWLLQRIISHFRPRLTWVVNSSLGYALIRRFGSGLKAFSRLACSVYGPGLTASGEMRGFAITDLPDTIEKFDIVVSDNNRIFQQFVSTFHLRQKFAVIRSPIDTNIQIKPKETIGERLSVLWAGRLDFDKNLPLFAEVVEKCADLNLPVDFSFYGSPVMHDVNFKFYIRKLRKLGVNYCGSFTSFDSLPVSLFDVFLYTSHSDGMPNVLLEAANSGMVVVSNNVGGIAELLDESNSYLVETNSTTASNMADALQQILNDWQSARMRTKMLQSQVSSGHNFAQFQQAIASLLSELQRQN